ncbi:MAG: hypothetical protein JXQ73_20770 [Phycisphaerae bacterium]|nr:hypothetical protein [Phycisphaerae bacterium]
MTERIDSTSEPLASAATRPVARALLVIVLGSLTVLLGIRGLTSATQFSQRIEITWPAAANAYIARRVQSGGVMYGDWRERPHVAAWYGPALYYPVAVVGRWIGADVHGLFMIGRWISLISTIGTAIVIMGLVLRRGDWPIAAMSGLVFLTADGILVSFDISFRPDAPACFLTVAGLALALHSRRRGVLYASVLLFLLSFLYKQSSIAGPPAVILWLWLNGRRRTAGIYGVLCIGLFAGISMLLNGVTDGRYFLNTIDALRGNTTLGSVPLLLSKAMQVAIFPMTIGLYAMVKEWSRKRWELDTFLLATSLLLAAAGTYRDGSGRYYYMLPLAAACVVSGRQLGSWWRTCGTVQWAGTALLVGMVVAALGYAPQAAYDATQASVYLRMYEQRGDSSRRREESFLKLAEYLNALPGPVLCQLNMIGLYCPRSIMMDTLTFTSMADVGAFDDGPLIQQIRLGEVAAIVLNPEAAAVYQSTDMFSRRWRQAMAGRYRRVQVPGLEGVHIYRPVSSLESGSGPGSGVDRPPS